MRFGAHWKLVLLTIGRAFLSTGRTVQGELKDRTVTPTGQQDSNQIRAFLLSFGYPVVEEDVARKVRAAQIASIARLTPFTVLANLINAIVIVPVFLGILPSVVVFGWLAAVVGLLTLTTSKWISASRSPIESASRRALDKAVSHATIFSALWAVVPIAAFSTGDANAIWIASCVTTGMICGGGFALATVPQAAIRWVAIIFIASAVSLSIDPSASTWPLLFLLSSYGVVIVCSVASAGWLFASHFLAEAELEHRGELIALLLNEFEEKASDWIWEADSQGTLRNISERFVHASGRTQDELETLRMVDLAYSLDETEARDVVGELEEALELQKTFRDRVIGVDVKGEERWWSLSARPVYDDHGSFAGYRGVASDITETRRANALVSHLAEHDSLTGIGNRSWFLKQAEQLLEEQAKTGRTTLTLFLIDLDNFKVVNDTSGHPAGDELLQQVASRFSAISEGRTVLARFGGDEFAALGQFVSDQAASAFAEELVNVTRKPFRIGRRDFAIGATVGFTRLRDDADTVDDLMRKADIALYKAKESGRGRALAFEADMEREVRERREMEADLREAFEYGKLATEFQPIVDARTGKVVSSEVLVRWYHPTRGEIGPDTFIPIAEHAGLILPLGNWVLKRACAAAAQCPELNSIAVNLSPVQFMDPNLVEQVTAVLAETGFPPERLVLEITESVFLKDFGTASTKLAKLRELGIRIALDDFGTGYSSLSYLRQYKFDKIKIDKSFVDEIGERSDGLAIISAVIALAHNLGLEVTAEGVERKFQVDALRTLGCDTMQGYYFGKPNANPMKITDVATEDWDQPVSEETSPVAGLLKPAG
ncbi:Phytochrome-like protein cph2 [Labrenzia sp. THAF82]|uniref:putative bifunctional diguanylate cyclase/phosphodiesterase n=1 Tax=Labrenzia sp. THAF82 TaxID=2587861 RepID=UPI0012686A52|nr:EAL domain-containing protein [Labrenzia sp. THAF82]QFT33422.1 Phytochrome-like protein cph2 [Labrenzia sp. THAF82]